MRCDSQTGAATGTAVLRYAVQEGGTMQITLYMRPFNGIHRHTYNISEEGRVAANDPGGRQILHVGDVGFDTELEARDAGAVVAQAMLQSRG